MCQSNGVLFLKRGAEKKIITYNYMADRVMKKKSKRENDPGCRLGEEEEGEKGERGVKM